MKVQIYNWAGAKGAGVLLEALGFRHQGFYDVENIFELVEKMHNAGLNIMLPQPVDGVQLIAVDYERLFGQR